MNDKAYIVGAIRNLLAAEKDHFEKWLDELEELIKQHDGSFYLRSKRIEKLTTPAIYDSPDVFVCIEFANKLSLLECFNSSKYLELMDRRSTYIIPDIFIVE